MELPPDQTGVARCICAGRRSATWAQNENDCFELGAMKIILASSERFSGCIIDTLRRHGHEVAGVVSPSKGIYDRQFRSPRFLLFRWRGWDILEACRKWAIDFRVSRHLEDGAVSAFIKSKRPDLLILFGWPVMVKPETLTLFPRGGMNIHPSLLPKLRGADPLFDIVDLCLDVFGITFHKLVDQLDAGPVFLQEPLRFNRRDTYDDLYSRLLDGIVRYLPPALDHLSRNPHGFPQKGEPSFVRKFKRSLRVLDPREDLEQVRQRTRACFSHHSRLTSCNGHLIHFSKCEPLYEFEPKYGEPAAIQKVDLFSLVVKLDRLCVRLGGVRFHDKPWWTTPFYLMKRCPPGAHLASSKTTRTLIREMAL